MNFVYHGSHQYFEKAKLKRSRRFGKSQTNTDIVIFDEVAFHATTHKWIALAYTYTPKSFTKNNKTFVYTIGVDLYKHTKELVVYGNESLEKSLEVMYGNGGFLFMFDNKDFFHKDGLGNLEVITKEEIKPIAIEYISNPVKELEKLGVSFLFRDATELN